LSKLVVRGVMKKTLDGLLREQKGQVLPIALAMLAIGSLIVVPLLNLIETVLKSGIHEESRMYEHYAADAGISDGLLQMIVNNPSLPAISGNWSYDIVDTNTRAVAVDIFRIDQTTWTIASTATSVSGNSTTLSSRVEEQTCAPNAITSASVTIVSGATINGDVHFDSTIGTLTQEGTINGEIIDRPIEFPTIAEVEAFYGDATQGAPEYEGDMNLSLGTETIGDPYSLGPIRVLGNLDIQANSEGAVRLDGIVYVEGDLSIGQNVRVYLNDHTLFAAGAVGVTISSGASPYGSGCIVARGSITVSSNTQHADYILVWSLMGDVDLAISGGYRGNVYCGESTIPGELFLQTGTTITWVEPPAILLPPVSDTVFRIVGWESSGQ